MVIPNDAKVVRASGFTLVEILVGLTLFISVALPMGAGLYTGAGSLRAEEALTAVWLLEQEAASVQLFADEGLSTRRRVVNGKEWTIRIHTEGELLARYTLSALKKGKKKGEIVVYGIKDR